MARQLHAINREHLATDQPLLIADGEDGREDVRDVLAQRADEVGEGGAVGRGVAAQGDERDVLLAGPRDAAAADDALRVGESTTFNNIAGG